MIHSLIHTRIHSRGLASITGGPAGIQRIVTTIEKTLKLSAPAIIFKHPIEETVRVFDADITAANLQGFFDNIGTPMVLGEGWVPHVQSIYDSFKDQRSQFVYTIFSAKKRQKQSRAASLIAPTWRG